MSSWIIKLNDEDAGKKAILKDSYALNYEVVRIQMIKAKFKINKNSSKALQKNSVSRPNLCCSDKVNSLVEIKYSF